MIAEPLCGVCKRKMVWIGLGGGAEPACPRDCGCCPRCNALPSKQSLVSSGVNPEAAAAAAARHAAAVDLWIRTIGMALPVEEKVQPETWMRCEKCTLDWKVTSWYSSGI